jgi:biotin operon repressor
MMAKDNKTQRPRPNIDGPVRLEAWLAANQPRLHPTQRKVLQAVADLCASGMQVPSSTVRETLGMSQQLLNRHLRTLESSGLLQLESPGAGLPLLARTTGLGQRALGLRGPQPAARPENERPDAPEEALGPQDQPSSDLASDQQTPASPAVSSRERLLRFIDRLYQDMTPYLAGLGRDSFQRLVSAAAAQSLGKASPLAPSAVEAPPAPQAALAAPAALAESVATAAELAAVFAQPRRLEAQRLKDGPKLNPAERALEDRLAQSAHPDHRHAPWWERTKELCAIWDQMRRHRLGVLGTYFNSFGPRWLHPDWEHFNRARCQADARGASYQDWVTSQYDRLTKADKGVVAPADLHGDEAAQAWQALHQERAQAQGRQTAGPPPYTPESFNVHNPDHVAYAEELLEEIGFLASRVYGHEPEGPIRLLVQAVGQGTLPLEALDLRPAWKARVQAAMGPVGTSPRAGLTAPGEPGRASAATPPPIII